MYDKVLCRFEQGSNAFLSADIRWITDQNVEVTHPITGEAVVFRSPEDDGADPTDLNIVLDLVPEGKTINISCPVLVPDTETDKAFAQVLIVDKKYKPLRVKVEFSDGRVAWLPHDRVRVMRSPWTRQETTRQTHLQKKRKLQTSHTTYKKGDIVRLPHGVLKKVVGV